MTATTIKSKSNIANLALLGFAAVFAFVVGLVNLVTAAA